MIGFKLVLMWSSVFITLCMFASVTISIYVSFRKMDSVLKIMQAVPDGKIRPPWPGIKVGLSNWVRFQESLCFLKAL